MSLLKLSIIIFSICLLFLLLSCEDKTITTPEETAKLSGYVYQESNGFFNYIQDAELTIGSFKTTTDSLGKYSIEIPFGEYSILCTHELYDTTIIESIIVDKNRIKLIKMNGGTFSITGTVSKSTGESIAGAIVEMDHLKDTTNINGNYIFSGIPRGKRTIVCDYSDYNIFNDTIEIVNNDVEKNISLLRQGYQISGTVSHPTDGLLSGIEVILDDTLYDTTDINGEYLFSDIYIGEHQLQIKSTIYDDQLIDFSLGKDDLIQNYELIKTHIYVQTVDTLWIEKDAEVAFYESSSPPIIDYANSNFGSSSRFNLLYELMYVTSHIDPPYFHEKIGRFFIELPRFSLDNIDSAYIVFSLVPNYILDEIVVSKVSNSWSEHEITWANQPEINDGMNYINPTIIDSSKWIIDVLEDTSIFLDTNGFRVSFEKEGCPFNDCLWQLSIHSSESTELDKRPYIIIYRTE